MNGPFDTLSQLVALVKTLETELQDLKLPPYYDPPRFHASFAWRLIAAEQAALLDATTLDELNEQCGERLRRETMLCSTICLKIGKQVERWTLM